MGAPSGSRVAFLAYFHLGCATLFPWSALITAADFWESQFPGKHMDRLLTVAYLPANLAALAVLLRHGSRLTPRMRVVGGFTGYTAIMLAVPLQAKLLTPSTPVLVCLLALVACAGVCDGAVQGALYGEAAGYPTTLFTRALTSGSSMAGVVVAFLRLATKATLPETPAGLAASASLYFLLAAAVTGGASAVYGWVLPRLAAVRHYRTIALEAALLGGSRTALLWVAIARAGFVPAFRLAAERQVGPPIVGGLTAALGATNGWVTACAMMAAPNGLHGAAASLAGTISVFSIVLGLCCGALLSFAWLL
ncbi:hypothetical protein CHLNCDRAFT_138452 [Chlorella variabilis]|uniref:Uncharacterized protein n=1 Tax=Chlorella variabilis TaxID=554065 RepID=E1ZN31_CHLVA|nr:hypothetical protein CHLNCDRAFT_138452 [Chlorella variabilis]EFN52799.1 hypothetical protein CHLNCDRAFT_138452 [Chlorella variabilis]|eukprot:XP_005844901.1 hypothetical protein CHLNCDRAFT_138452 [Chlorella variabilis]